LTPQQYVLGEAVKLNGAADAAAGLGDNGLSGQFAQLWLE
jgi:hypothetical protein